MAREVCARVGRWQRARHCHARLRPLHRAARSGKRRPRCRPLSFPVDGAAPIGVPAHLIYGFAPRL
eukprot:3596041-Heterocapsa_arctica.AAC.1